MSFCWTKFLSPLIFSKRTHRSVTAPATMGVWALLQRRRRLFFFPLSSFLLLHGHSLPFRHISGSGVEVLTGGGSAREGLSTGDVSAASGATVRFEKKWFQGGVGFWDGSRSVFNSQIYLSSSPLAWSKGLKLGSCVVVVSAARVVVSVFFSGLEFVPLRCRRGPTLFLVR